MFFRARRFELFNLILYFFFDCDITVVNHFVASYNHNILTTKGPITKANFKTQFRLAFPIDFDRIKSRVYNFIVKVVLEFLLALKIFAKVRLRFKFAFVVRLCV